MAEELGIEGRADYYDHAGAVRDVVQNHLSQLLALVAMEVPYAFEADAIRGEKVKALRSVSPIRPEHVILGQYTAGRQNGTRLPGYREEPGVRPESTTETFAVMRLFVNTWRWQGVPFTLRTGKRLAQRMTEIAVAFRDPPIRMFQAMEDCRVQSNVLVLRLQPNEGFELHVGVKAPGSPMKVESLPLHFNYAEAFAKLPEAYQTLLLDVLEGDQSLFVRADEVEAAWRLFDPLLTAKLPVLPYPAGSWGPAEATRISRHTPVSRVGA